MQKAVEIAGIVAAVTMIGAGLYIGWAAYCVAKAGGSGGKA